MNARRRGRPAAVSALRVVPLLAAALLVAAGPASAERLELSRYGARLGFSLDPDQFVIGGYAGFGELARNLGFRPSLDLGFGSSVFTLVGNADLQYSFRNVDFPVVPYLGAGVALAWYRLSDDPPGGDRSSSEVGLNLYTGAEKGFGDYYSGHAELRIGIDDIPDLKFVVGFGFY